MKPHLTSALTACLFCACAPLAATAALLADPARARMLAALMSGEALTAGELARVAGVTAATASGHLAKLAEGGLVLVHRERDLRAVRVEDGRGPCFAAGVRDRGHGHSASLSVTVNDTVCSSSVESSHEKSLRMPTRTRP